MKIILIIRSFSPLLIIVMPFIFSLYWWLFHEYRVPQTHTWSHRGYEYLIAFAYSGGYSTNIGKIKDMCGLPDTAGPTRKFYSKYRTSFIFCSAEGLKTLLFLIRPACDISFSQNTSFPPVIRFTHRITTAAPKKSCGHSTQRAASRSTFLILQNPQGGYIWNGEFWRLERLPQNSQEL